jgi:hypothetical protein
LQAGVPAHQVQTIRIPQPGYGKQSGTFTLCDDKECWYNGKLYDIISTKITQKEHIYYCVFDKQETVFITWFLSLIKQKFSPLQRTNPALFFLQHIKTLFCCAVLIVVFSSTVSRGLPPIRRIIRDLIQIPPFTPPPEISPVSF